MPRLWRRRSHTVWGWPHVLLWLGTALALAGAVWGPWVPAAAAGLRVLGVDMAEAVKFLPAVRNGQLPIWYQGFLLPQFLLSLFLSVHAWQHRWPWPLAWRLGLQVLALMVALSMLPPAWTPATLQAPEWLWHVRLIGTAAAFALLAPIWRWLPSALGDGVLAILGLGTGVWVAGTLPQVWPHFEAVYHASLTPGWGVWALGLGITGLLILLSEHIRRSRLI